MLIDRIRTCLQHNEAEWMTRSEIAKCLNRNRDLMYPRDIELLEELVSKFQVEKGYVNEDNPAEGFKYRYKPKPIREIIRRIICDANSPISIGEISETLRNFYKRDFTDEELKALKNLVERGYVENTENRYRCGKPHNKNSDG